MSPMWDKQVHRNSAWCLSVILLMQKTFVVKPQILYKQQSYEAPLEIFPTISEITSEIIMSIPPEVHRTFECPPGFTLDGTTRCTRTVPAPAVLVCPPGTKYREHDELMALANNVAHFEGASTEEETDESSGSLSDDMLIASDMLTHSSDENFRRTSISFDSEVDAQKLAERATFVAIPSKRHMKRRKTRKRHLKRIVDRKINDTSMEHVDTNSFSEFQCFETAPLEVTCPEGWVLRKSGELCEFEEKIAPLTVECDLGKPPSPDFMDSTGVTPNSFPHVFHIPLLTEDSDDFDRNATASESVIDEDTLSVRVKNMKKALRKKFGTKREIESVRNMKPADFGDSLASISASFRPTVPSAAKIRRVSSRNMAVIESTKYEDSGDSQQVPGDSHSQQVPGDSHSQQVPGDSHSQQVPGDSHSQQVPGEVPGDSQHRQNNEQIPDDSQQALGSHRGEEDTSYLSMFVFSLERFFKPSNPDMSKIEPVATTTADGSPAQLVPGYPPEPPLPTDPPVIVPVVPIPVDGTTSPCLESRPGGDAVIIVDCNSKNKTTETPFEGTASPTFSPEATEAPSGNPPKTTNTPSDDTIGSTAKPGFEEDSIGSTEPPFSEESENFPMVPEPPTQSPITPPLMRSCFDKIIIEQEGCPIGFSFNEINGLCLPNSENRVNLPDLEPPQLQTYNATVSQSPNATVSLSSNTTSHHSSLCPPHFVLSDDLQNCVAPLETYRRKPRCPANGFSGTAMGHCLRNKIERSELTCPPNYTLHEGACVLSSAIQGFSLCETRDIDSDCESCERCWLRTVPKCQENAKTVKTENGKMLCVTEVITEPQKYCAASSQTFSNGRCHETRYNNPSLEIATATSFYLPDILSSNTATRSTSISCKEGQLDEASRLCITVNSTAADSSCSQGIYINYADVCVAFNVTPADETCPPRYERLLDKYCVPISPKNQVDESWRKPLSAVPVANCIDGVLVNNKCISVETALPDISSDSEELVKDTATTIKPTCPPYASTNGEFCIIPLWEQPDGKASELPYLPGFEVIISRTATAVHAAEPVTVQAGEPAAVQAVEPPTLPLTNAAASRLVCPKGFSLGPEAMCKRKHVRIAQETCPKGFYLHVARRAKVPTENKTRELLRRERDMIGLLDPSHYVCERLHAPIWGCAPQAVQVDGKCRLIKQVPARMTELKVCTTDEAGCYEKPIAQGRDAADANVTNTSKNSF